VVFIVGFGVEDWFHGGKGSVTGDEVPYGHVMTAAMARLDHVDIEPIFVVDELGGGEIAAGGVVGDQGLRSQSLFDAFGHGSPHGAPVLFILFGRAVAPEDPDEVGNILVAAGQPEAIFAGIFRVEYHGSRSPHPGHLVSPGGEQPEVHIAVGSHADHLIDQGKVFLIGACGIQVDEGDLPLLVGFPEAVHFGQDHRLDDVETFGRAVVEVAGDLLRGKPVEEFPGGIAQPEEGGAVAVLQEVAVGRHLQGTVVPEFLCGKGADGGEVEKQGDQQEGRGGEKEGKAGS
jgi:hypothetical protein